MICCWDFYAFKMSCSGPFYKCFPSVTWLHCHCLQSDRKDLCLRGNILHFQLEHDMIPVMALMGFAFLSLRIPSGNSFKPVLCSAGSLREAGNQVFSPNYGIKWNYQEVIKFLVTSLLTTMLQPMENLRKRRIWMFCCSICHDLGLTDHASSITWSAQMFWQAQRGSARPWVQAVHEAATAMDFCKVCTLILRENAATELPPETGSWNSLALAEFTQNMLGWGASLPAVREFVFSWQRFINCGGLL